ncbi:MAG: type I-E CRISPR-associated protein Cse2/CasB [Pseudomonadota bacterium]|nr:type I-E CRISPR-associated protein Cse2/CasB [Pseudomonadota bacterium]
MNFHRDEQLRGALRRWWGGLEHDRAARAELRRAANITAVTLTPAYQRAYRRLLEAGWPETASEPQNDRLAAVVGLLAHVKADDTRTPSATMSARDGSERPALSPMRFQRLLESPDLDTLYTGLRRALPLVKHQINLVALANDLVYWGDAVKKRWAYDYDWPQKGTD